MIAISRVTNIARDWGDLAPFFERAVTRVQTNRTIDNILREAMSGDLALWAITDTADGALLGALSTGWRKDVNGQTVIFSDLGGDDMHRWLDLIVGKIETLAKGHGATRAELTGRLGWARVMKRFGYAPTRITMQKVL